MNLFFRLNLLLLFFFCIPDLIAQTDFRPGYVITNENDTLKGMIDYRGDSRNSQICVYKENETSASKEYLPGKIKGYRFLESKYYVSKNILVEGVKKDLFLEFLVNGIANLYYYREFNDNPHYFIEKRDGQLFELKNTEGLIEKNFVHYSHEKKEYIGLLKYAFADCPQLFETIDNTTLDTKSLVNITKKYHNYVCNDEKCIIYEKRLPVIKLRFAPYLSMNATSFNFINSNHLNYYYQEVKYQITSYPSIGIRMNTSLPQTSEKLSFQVSAEIGRNYIYGNGNYPENTFNEFHLHNTFLTGKGGFKYTYPTGKLRPTMMIGANMIMLLDKEGKRMQDANYNGTIYASEYEEKNLIADRLYGYNLDLGIDYHLSAVFVPFITIGYTSSTGANSKPASYNKSEPLISKFKTLNINVGLYF